MRPRLSLVSVIACVVAAIILAAGGCNPVLFLNPAFINTTTGSVFPLTPGDRAGFVLVRGNNATQDSIEFVVTAERQVIATDGSGETIIETQTFRLLTQPVQLANDIGVVIECPVLRVGLGEDLNRPGTEPGVFVGATAAGAGGFGIPANVNPLDASVGNFACGDTVVFQAAVAGNVVGGIAVASFVLDADSQPTEVIGPDTFVNMRTLIEQQSGAEDDE